MKTITIKISDEEFLALSTYADMCGESVPDLIYKVLIQEITFMKNDPSTMLQQYVYDMLVPEGVLDEEKLITSNYNKIRKILGIKEMK